MFEFGNATQPDMRHCFGTFTWNELGVREVIGEGDSLKWEIGCAFLNSLNRCKLVAFITL